MSNEAEVSEIFSGDILGELCPKLEEVVICPNCKEQQRIRDLNVQAGALISNSICQKLFVCGCGRPLVCDTSGMGNFVLQNGTVFK